MNNKITLYIKTIVMLAFIMFGVFVIFSSSIYPISADNTKKLEKSISAPSQNHPASEFEKKLKIAFLTDGLFSDAGWGAFGYNAAQALEGKYSYMVDYKENVPIPKIEETLRDYANSGYDIIISHGFEWGKPAVKVGKDYPETKFVIFTGLVNSSNVASIYPMQQEGTYVLGALAATMSKTGIIGFVGGERYPNLINIYEGYKQGAQDVNPAVKILVTYLDDWDNSTKGKKAAISQIDRGADFLLQVADTSGHGVIEAAKERGIYAFGAISDQNKLAPNTVLTSFVLDAEKAFDRIITLVKTSNFSGQIFKPGLEAEKGASGDGIVYIAPFHSLEHTVSDNVKLRLEKLKEDIINGNIKVPERYSNNIGNYLNNTG
ncbi:Purine-binding protein precursor [Candidatus Nitrosocosmicus oleophilus]|uniref:Purine-binding protein n=1 Tax=Candidatus Nitrosocosmicus oleophilus TaxID=1353260 RepID=A0A654LWE8_9ARCH|nr:BMP family protein [Candidatus Nitrosocosmicus oleophilus]ALI35768.1 Purine-binding protein precursor [Candidatus Nitrosocosmicus oleophilus]